MFCTELEPEPWPPEAPQWWGDSDLSIVEHGQEPSGPAPPDADPYELLLSMILDFVTDGDDDDDEKPPRWSPAERSPADPRAGRSHGKLGKRDSPEVRPLKAGPPAGVPVGQSMSGVRLEGHKGQVTVEPLAVGWKKPVKPGADPPVEAGRLPTVKEEGCIELFIQEEEEEEEEGGGSDAEADCRLPNTGQKVEHDVWPYTCGF